MENNIIGCQSTKFQLEVDYSKSVEVWKKLLAETSFSWFRCGKRHKRVPRSSFQIQVNRLFIEIYVLGCLCKIKQSIHSWKRCAEKVGASVRDQNHRGTIKKVPIAHKCAQFSRFHQYVGQNWWNHWNVNKNWKIVIIIWRRTNKALGTYGSGKIKTESGSRKQMGWASCFCKKNCLLVCQSKQSGDEIDFQFLEKVTLKHWFKVILVISLPEWKPLKDKKQRNKAKAWMVNRNKPC